MLKGGDIVATDGNCSLGPPLGRFVDTFLGISGPNFGLCVCQLAQTVPAWCNALDGLYPGYSCDDQVNFNFLLNYLNEFICCFSCFAVILPVNALNVTILTFWKNSTTIQKEKPNTFSKTTESLLCNQLTNNNNH